MKLKRTKKGFTIIELVIVIAVIGILAAVLIPTFVNLTNKANEAADNALVNNLNKALKMEEQEPGHQKAPTLEGAIKDLEDQGYLLENLASKSGKDLLWSQSENQFLLNTEGKSGKDYWKIVDAVPAKADQKYSYYAGKNFSQTDITVKYGFDAGRNDGIAKVTYEGTGTAQEVAIRTNDGNLTINAASDKVYHYGKADALDIITVAPTSYHENGTVGYAKIATGRLVVEKTAVIDGIYLVANSSGEFDGIKLAVVGDARLPEVARADVELAAGQSKLVVEVQTLQTSEGTDANPEYVWISNTGTTEDPVVTATVSSSDNASDYATHVVEEPTPAAAVTKETVDVSATEIDETSVARVGAVGYDSFASAFSAAKSGNTIVMLKNVSLTSANSLSKSITLDLNGTTISSTAILFNIYSSNINLTIKDSGNDGAINVTSTKIIHSSGSNNNIVIEGGALSLTASGSNGAIGISLSSGSNFEMKGGSIDVSGAGPSSWWQTWNYYGVQNTGPGNVVISGGEIICESASCNYALSSNSGTVLVSGGRIESTNKNNSSVAPYAVYITGGTASITGGTIVVVDKDNYGWSEGHLVTGSTIVTGGTFISTVSVDISGLQTKLASGYSLQNSGNNTWLVVKN